jgi:alpha-beta hydrolase superfamily lysophospholipase
LRGFGSEEAGGRKVAGGRLKGKLARAALSFFASLLVAPAIAPQVQASPTCDVTSDIGQHLKLPVYRWHDDTQPVNGYIVGIHGLTFYASAFDSLAQNLSSKGFEFYAADIRGFGRWKTESAKFGGDEQIHFSQAEEDVKQICETLRRQHPGAKVYILGESLGANLAFWLASNHSNLVDGIIVSGPCFETEVHPSPRWAVDVVRGLAHPNKPLNLTPYITPYLSNDKELTQSCLNDEKICRNLSPVDLYKAGRTNKEALANLSHIPASMPVLIIAGEQDKVMHTAAIPKQLPKIGSKQISVNVIPQRGHLLLEHQKVDNKIAKILDNFLDVRPVTANANAGVAAAIASQPARDSEPVVSEQAQTTSDKVQTLSLGLLDE